MSHLDGTETRDAILFLKAQTIKNNKSARRILIVGLLVNALIYSLTAAGLSWVSMRLKHPEYIADSVLRSLMLDPEESRRAIGNGLTRSAPKMARDLSRLFEDLHVITVNKIEKDLKVRDDALVQFLNNKLPTYVEQIALDDAKTLEMMLRDKSPNRSKRLQAHFSEALLKPEYELDQPSYGTFDTLLTFSTMLANLETEGPLLPEQRVEKEILIFAAEVIEKGRK